MNANTERKLPISISIKYATKGYVIYLGLKKKTLKQKKHIFFHLQFGTKMIENKTTFIFFRFDETMLNHLTGMNISIPVLIQKCTRYCTKRDNSGYMNS